MIGAILAIVGCTSYTPGPAPNTVAIKGRILLSSGNPVPGGMLTFKPKTPGKYQTGTAEIGKDGTFAATSFNKGDGLQPGEEYVIYVEPTSYKTGKAVSIKGIPTKYQTANTSDITLKVEKAEENLVLRMK